jgi:cell division protein FtsB
MEEMTLAGQLEAAQREIEVLKAEKARLETEVAKLRGLLRIRQQDTMSTKLKDALRE